jgi:hypothetical protein
MPRNIPSLFRSLLSQTVAQMDLTSQVLLQHLQASIARPFSIRILYGHTPKHFGITDHIVSPVQDVASMVAEHQTMLAAVRQHLLRAQQCMKSQADKNHSD